MTVEQRGRFLRELALTGNIAFACKIAGVTRGAAMVEREARPLFEIQWRDAQRRARLALEARLHP